MTETTDLLVFWLVVLTRFLVPLLIPRFPLPAIIAALIIDAIDQTIFQTFTNLDLEGYQGYDKALDIYYLTIAYIATLRNWTNLIAFRVSRFLMVLSAGRGDVVRADLCAPGPALAAVDLSQRL